MGMKRGTKECSECGTVMMQYGPVHVTAPDQEPIRTKQAFRYCEECDRWEISYSGLEKLLRACVGKIPERKQLLVRLPAPVLELFKQAAADRGTTVNARITDYVTKAVKSR